MTGLINGKNPIIPKLLKYKVNIVETAIINIIAIFVSFSL